MKVQNFPIFCLSLIPLGYILKGGLPFDLTLVLYIILYVISMYQIIIKCKNIYFTKADIVLFVWLFLMIFGVYFTPSQYEGAFKVAEFLFLGLSLIYFIRLFVTKENDIWLFFKYLLINSILTNFIVIFDFYMSGSSIGRYEAFDQVVPIPLSLLGVMTLLLLIILFYYKKINITIFFVGLFSSITIVTLAASKGPVLSLVITLILLLPIFLKKIKIKFLIILVITTFILSQIDLINNSMEVLLSRFDNLSTSMSTNERIAILNNTFEVIQKNPILGVGTGALESYPHNVFLEILAENGLILFLLATISLLIFICYYIVLIMKKEYNLVEVLIFALLICSISSLMFSFTYVDHKYLFISIGLLIVYKSREKYENFKSKHREMN